MPALQASFVDDCFAWFITQLYLLWKEIKERSILATWIEGPVQNLKRIPQKTLQLPFFFPVQLIFHTSMRIIRLISIIEIGIIIKFVKKKIRKQV